MLKNYIITNLWLNNQLGGVKNKSKVWNTFQHNGVMFPSEYEQINIPLIYDGKKIILNNDAEEASLFYAKYLETEYIKNPRFNKNFWKDYKKILNKDLNIIDFNKCDFTLFYKYLISEKEKKMSLTKEDKIKIKEKDLIKEVKFKQAFVDGKLQKVGNFRIEPPGIFLGRGCHPKIGRIKKRIYPEDITINISKGVKIPETGIKGRKWGNIIHNNKSLMIASWKENVLGKTKYVWLSDQSDYKAKSDLEKFDLAKKLKKKITEIRKINYKNLKLNNIKSKQLATVLYFIDKLALRIGNEKGKNQADTVGISSLRIEHITLLGSNKIKLDFLGKDSIRYVKKFEIDNLIYNNLVFFIENKNRKDKLFDKINTIDINKYLNSFMNKLTSKVFRTMNASKLFQKELKKINIKFEKYNENDKINLLLDQFNKANAKVALLCNHQKSVSKNFKEQINKFNTRIKELKKKRNDYENKKKIFKDQGKNVKTIRERIKKINLKIINLKSRKNLKIDLKSVSLGTSKVNYIDPRITIAFMKKHNINIDKLFTKVLQEKFHWAMTINIDYIF